MGKIVIDSNVLVGFIRAEDSLHKKAVELIKKIKKENEIWVLNLVIQETATVLSMRDGMKSSGIFCDNYRDLVDQEIFLDKDLEDRSWNIFRKQEKKGTSFIDCANLALLEKYKLNGIASFDEFYSKSIRVM